MNKVGNFYQAFKLQCLEFKRLWNSWNYKKIYKDQPELGSIKYIFESCHKIFINHNSSCLEPKILKKKVEILFYKIKKYE